jgi:hypothetical protein
MSRTLYLEGGVDRTNACKLAPQANLTMVGDGIAKKIAGAATAGKSNLRM